MEGTFIILFGVIAYGFSNAITNIRKILIRTKKSLIGEAVYVVILAISIVLILRRTNSIEAIALIAFGLLTESLLHFCSGLGTDGIYARHSNMGVSKKLIDWENLESLGINIDENEIEIKFISDKVQYNQRYPIRKKDKLLKIIEEKMKNKNVIIEDKVGR